MIDSRLRQAYVRCMHALRAVFRPLGILALLEKRRERRGCIWLRSLFAIYDFDDLSNLDLPWWSFDAIDAVEKFLKHRPGARVFEYGSGASTVWLSRRAREIYSVEDNPDWFSLVQSRLADCHSLNLLFRPSHRVAGREIEAPSGRPEFKGLDYSDYVRAIDDVGGEFDLIVIDGRARNSCLEAAAKYLHPDGIIVFDDSKRARYREAIERSNLEAWDARGLAACLPFPDQTTLLARNRAILHRLRNGHHSACG